MWTFPAGWPAADVCACTVLASLKELLLERGCRARKRLGASSDTRPRPRTAEDKPVVPMPLHVH